MKKIVLFVLCASLLLLAACTPKVTACDEGLKLISLMDEMVGSDDYITLFTASEDMHELIKTARSGDYKKPSAVYELKITDEGIMGLLSAYTELDSLPPDIRDFVIKKACSAIVTYANARAGANVLAASSVCTASRTFVNKSIKEPTAYLYVFRSGCPVIVSFLPGEDGAVEASGSFVFNEALDTTDESTVNDFFSKFAIECRLLK